MLTFGVLVYSLTYFGAYKSRNIRSIGAILCVLMFSMFRFESGGDWFSYQGYFMYPQSDSLNLLKRIALLPFIVSYTHWNIIVSLLIFIPIMLRLGLHRTSYLFASFFFPIVPLFFNSLLKSAVVLSLVFYAPILFLLIFPTHPATAILVALRKFKIPLLLSVLVALNFGFSNNFELYAQYLYGYNSKGFLFRLVLFSVNIILLRNFKFSILLSSMLFAISTIADVIADRLLMIILILCVLEYIQNERLKFSKLRVIGGVNLLFLICYSFLSANRAFFPWRISLNGYILNLI